MLKLQKEIDETKTAIAAAELNRMTAEKNIADMITSTQNIAPAAPAPAATNQAAPPPPPQVIHGPPVKSEASYTLMSVSYEGGRWSAVVGLEGKLFTVSVGDVLQPDDSVVMAINKKEIQLKRDTRTRTVAISSSPL
jgi:type IV pilus biogenesis protein PilP